MPNYAEHNLIPVNISIVTCCMQRDGAQSRLSLSPLRRETWGKRILGNFWVLHSQAPKYLLTIVALGHVLVKWKKRQTADL